MLFWNVSCSYVYNPHSTSLSFLQFHEPCGNTSEALPVVTLLKLFYVLKEKN